MHPGNSGGPVVDKDGNLVGIAVAAYSGTQLHLAIPTEMLNSVLNGRIMNIVYGVPYRDNDKLKVPFRFEKADPLGIMKSIALETWVGAPGKNRDATSTKPEPLPGDSPVTVLEVKPNEKGIYSGELTLDGNKDPKLVYWSRPQIGRGADKTRWYPATILSARLGTSVDRKPISIKYEPPLDKADILALNSDATFRIREGGGDDHSIAMIIKGTLEEKVVDQTKAGRWHKRLTYDGVEATVTEDKKQMEGADAFLKALRDAPKLAAEIDIEKNGSVARTMVDSSKVPRASQRALALVSRQVQQSLDSLALPLPAKEIAPLETWKGKQSYILGALGLAIPATAEVTYKYEGMYTRDNRTLAVISFEGPLQGDFEKPKKGGKEPTLTGKVDGKIELFADTGLVQFGTERIRAEVAMESDGKPLKLIGSLSVTERRNPVLPKKK
jgi:hypothetical protein